MNTPQSHHVRIDTLITLEQQGDWDKVLTASHALAMFYSQHHATTIDIVLLMSANNAVECAKAFIDKTIELREDSLEYLDELLATLASNHMEDKAYLYLLHILGQYPDCANLIQKAADLSLYLGYMDEAYHWTASLAFYSSAQPLSIRKSRLDLFLRKKTPSHDFQVITGQVFSRSTHPSFRPEDPPGEKEILALNPEREEKLKSIANCEHLHAGTLNLRTHSHPTDIFHRIAPVAYEAGENVTYTPKYAHVPKQRIGYWYYKGFIFSKDRYRPVLFKYPDVPYSEFTLEIFSAHHLREELNLSDNEHVLCYFTTHGNEEEAWLACKLKIYATLTRNQQPFEHGALHQAHEHWHLPGQRPTLLRMEAYGLTNWIAPHHHILDIGCNIGCLGIETAKLASGYTGFDCNPDLIAIAHHLARHQSVNNCQFLACTFNEFLAQNKQQYDVIFSFAAHVWIGLQIKDYINQLRGMLAPQGTIIIESDNLDNDTEFMQNMRFFLASGFILLHQGEIIDDEVITRAFCVFKSLQ